VNLKPLRIWLRRWKALAIVVGVLLQVVLFAPLLWLSNEVVHGVLSSVIQFAIVYLTTRVFRGLTEERLPPRPWWRMTAKPTAGVLLGLFFTIEALICVRDFATGGSAAFYVTGVIEYAALATLYFVSSARLATRARIATTELST